MQQSLSRRLQDTPIADPSRACSPRRGNLIHGSATRRDREEGPSSLDILSLFAPRVYPLGDYALDKPTKFKALFFL